MADLYLVDHINKTIVPTRIEFVAEQNEMSEEEFQTEFDGCPLECFNPN